MSFAHDDHSFTGFDQAVVVEVETTGLDPMKDRILRIACLRGSIADFATKGFTDLDEFRVHLNPSEPYSARGKAFANIHYRVTGNRTFAEIAAELREFIGPLPLIGHLVSYDRAFLAEEFRRAGEQPLQNKSYCIMKRLREHFGYSEGYMSLAEACERLGLEGRVGAHHDAAENNVLALQLAGCLYRLDNGLPPATTRAPGHVAGAGATVAAGGRNFVLVIVLSILGAASTLLVRDALLP